MKLGKIMNPFEKSAWVLFSFMASIILIAFIFVAEQISQSRGIKTDDELRESRAEKIEVTETK
ncbi:MAG: hypothetical protein CVU62_08490 [Deltaproteobacteria bacterium HGW-Deltaproteobacteria-2]|jgi:TRAP-type C4-dicarboxylate transport system permease small subunit|nr:MAG: hypothetical protein CVU62_08490 [Deltaproteobacteria bacterium HGW-Deltaproteobacteria-2]